MILECELRPRCLPQDQGVLTIVVEEFNLHFMDSYRFFPEKLANLPLRFGLEQQKGHYAHKNNTPDNWNRVRKASSSCRLNINHGDTEKKRLEKKKCWMEVQSQTNPYDFNLDTLNYCRTDVFILTVSCCKFLKQSFEFGQLLLQRFGQSPVWKPTSPILFHPFNFATLGSYR